MVNTKSNTQKRSFQELNLCNMFLFNAVFRNPENCKILLEILLNRSVDVVDVKVEDTVLVSSDVKYIRLDVLATDTYNTKYDFEPQRGNEYNLPKRSRYYQSLMDVASLEPGESYDKLGETYVIFICTFDPFGRGKYMYIYTNRSDDSYEPLGDGTTKIFFNTKGTDRENISDELFEFLKYFDNSTDESILSMESDKVRKLHERVRRIKGDRKWEEGYMTVEEYANQRAREVTAEVTAQVTAEVTEQVTARVTIEVNRENVLENLEELGTINDEVLEIINSQSNIDVLKKWHKLAAKVDSIEEFLQKIKNI